MKKKGTAVARVSLTRKAVLESALQMIDENGIEALSMRQLGTKLGVEAMSLYNHVANKEDILEGVLDMVVEEIVIPDADADWRSAMKERAVSALAAFNRHPWASAMMDSRVSFSPARLRYFDSIVGSLVRAGFPLEAAAHAFSLLDCYVYGFGRQKSNKAATDDNPPEKQAEEFHDNIPLDAYPYVTKLAELSMKNGYDENADFEFGINLILDGLERLLPASLAGRDRTW